MLLDSHAIGQGVLAYSGRVARPKLTREAKKARTRQALVDAATQLFADRGFHATSLEHVAEQAGFTIGAVYSNFTGKEDLFFAVLDRWGLEEAAALAQAVGVAGTDTAEAIVAAIDTWFRERWTDPERLFTIAEFVLHCRARPAALDALRQRVLLVHAGLQALIQQTRTDLPLAADLDSEDTARAVIAISYGIAVQRLIEPDQPVGALVSQLVRRLVLEPR